MRSWETLFSARRFTVERLPTGRFGSTLATTRGIMLSSESAPKSPRTKKNSELNEVSPRGRGKKICAATSRLTLARRMSPTTPMISRSGLGA